MKKSLVGKLKLYFNIESTSLLRYCVENIIIGLFGWVPSVLGIVIRLFFYRLILNAKKFFIVQSGVILKQPQNITLHKGVYLDHRVYLHACLNGIEIGENTRIMYNAQLHVYNFRDIPNAGIKIGKNCVVGPYTFISGQGGTTIGDNVIIAPHVVIVPVNHGYEKSDIPIREQGITTRGVTIDDDVWIGAGVTILDDVHIGKGSVLGAGTVVTESVPQYTLVVGAKQKVIRSWGP